MCSMRRIFEERARLVIYIESADLNRMTEEARKRGVPIVEWARKVLLESISGEENHRDKDVQRVGTSAAVKRGRGTPKRIPDHGATSGEQKAVSAPSDAADVCGHELCGHARKQHGHKYCSVVNCRCTGFEERA